MVSKKRADIVKYLRRKGIFYLMCLPYLIGFALFQLYPMIDAFVLSFHSWSGGIGGAAFLQPNFVGLRNYEYMIGDGLFLLSLENSLLSTLAFVVISTAVSLGIALILDQKLRGTSLYKTIYFIPFAAAPAIIGVVMRIIFNKGGVINWILNGMNLPAVNWFGAQLALLTVVVAMVWQYFGYCVVILSAGLQAIPTTFYEAASIDGAGKITQIRQITLPLLKPILVVTLFLETVYGLRAYDVIYSMTRGGPGFQTLTLPYYIYWKGFESWDLAYADAIGVVLFLIALAITLAQRRLIGTATVEY